MTKLKYISDRALTSLKKDVPNNLKKYKSGNFEDLIEDPTWDISLELDYDEDLFAKINEDSDVRSAKSDLEMSVIVGKALGDLTPSLANEERVWARLCHIEAFEYTRKRWLPSEATGKLIGKHFFATGLNGIRDDNAISRLWWNYRIAKNVFPDDPERALKQILKSADIRSSIIERPWSSTRHEILHGIIRAMEEKEWITSSEANFRAFMRQFNKYGGGLVYEACGEELADSFVLECEKAAERELS